MGRRSIKAKRRNEKNSNRISRTLNQQTSLSRKSTNSQVLHLQRKYGNSILQRMYESGALQAKLKIGKPGDRYEREADSVADRVMSMPEPDISRQEDKEEKIRSKPLAEQITPLVQRQTEEEEEIKKQPEEEEEEAQAKFLQRQEEEEEMQKQPEEDEEPVQTKLLQRQPEDEEEVQKQPEEEEEAAQAKFIQRQEEGEEVQPQAKEEEEEAAQSKTLQRQAEEEEEPAQAKLFQRQEEEEKETVQAKGSGETSHTMSPSVESGINSIRGGGQPLSESSRAFFEPRFGTDFSSVKVHTGANANHLAGSINAKAFTVGKDVVFGSGQYSPDTSEGKRLMSHELTHVVQQSNVLPVIKFLNNTEDKSQDSSKVDTPNHKSDLRLQRLSFSQLKRKLKTTSPYGTVLFRNNSLIKFIRFLQILRKMDVMATYSLEKRLREYPKGQKNYFYRGDIYFTKLTLPQIKKGVKTIISKGDTFMTSNTVWNKKITKAKTLLRKFRKKHLHTFAYLQGLQMFEQKPWPPGNVNCIATLNKSIETLYGNKTIEKRKMFKYVTVNARRTKKTSVDATIDYLKSRKATSVPKIFEIKPKKTWEDYEKTQDYKTASTKLKFTATTPASWIKNKAKSMEDGVLVFVGSISRGYHSINIITLKYKNNIKMVWQDQHRTEEWSVKKINNKILRYNSMRAKLGSNNDRLTVKRDFKLNNFVMLKPL